MVVQQTHLMEELVLLEDENNEHHKCTERI